MKKANLKFLIPSKKTVFVFTIMTIIMSLASLQGEAFSESKPSILYKVLSWATEPAWKIWLYISAPILYFFGLAPQSTIRWAYLESWELVYGLNFAYYYLVASVAAYLWNFTRRFGMSIRK